jgi:hypothetical protein
MSRGDFSVIANLKFAAPAANPQIGDGSQCACVSLPQGEAARAVGRNRLPPFSNPAGRAGEWSKRSKPLKFW